MSFLYSCRHDGDQYRITKLTHNLDVESSYLCTFDECECPAGVRPTCRHREMLPRFVERGAISTGWMYDYDRGGWVDNRTEDELSGPLDEGAEAISLEMIADAEEYIDRNPSLAPAPKIGLKINPNPEPGKGFVEFTTTLQPATWRRF